MSHVNRNRTSIRLMTINEDTLVSGVAANLVNTMTEPGEGYGQTTYRKLDQ